MPTTDYPPHNASSSDEITLFMFQPIKPTDRYPAYLPTIQVSSEAADFLLPVVAGAALVRYFDDLTEPVIYSTDKLVNFEGYRNALQRKPKFSSIGMYRCGYITSQPDDGLDVRTSIDYRTMSEGTVAVLRADAHASKLDDLLCRWVLNHTMALENCGGFTLLLVSIREVPQHTGEPDRKPHQTRLTERGVANRRRSFKSYLAVATGS